MMTLGDDTRVQEAREINMSRFSPTLNRNFVREETWHNVSLRVAR